MSSTDKPKIGDTLPPFVIDSVSPDAMRDWSVFLADPNPIHLDVEVVKAKGLGDKRINQGPINVAYMMNMLMVAFPGCRVESMDSRFLDNVYEGDRATASGEVTSVEGNRVSCDIKLEVDGRGTVNAGTATILI
ncbi:MaoC/PaaZ C-terminal domain-containing protein [Croceicoccus sp. F390]|uniref:MaoC/PaaZ C-terminal domain-containing protein n=1 Tax=Croceicoccus esteveae TaxID=3075597 RepID=A0ABU2ZI99_9SPHN|nr:MaoC/PaaZ C-terminal domain-containing protein [Croceicoccus sp. F390]MDT0576327.1 MaoC/PaaZ C-terminal domain-containing protein [Croceicoccus sp. F390]